MDSVPSRLGIQVEQIVFVRQPFSGQRYENLEAYSVSTARGQLIGALQSDPEISIIRSKPSSVDRPGLVEVCGSVDPLQEYDPVVHGYEGLAWRIRNGFCDGEILSHVT